MADNWLKQYGYNAVALPRRDISPIDVLLRGDDGEYQTKVGNLPMILKSGTPLPDVSPDEPAANIGRKIEKKVNVSLGLKILGALFGGSKASKLGADTSVKHARELSITYEDVTQDSVAVLELDAWMEDAKVQASNQAMLWLNDEKLAAVTAVLRTAKLSVAATGENSASIDLSVPEIQGIVSGDAKVEVSSSDSSKVTFTGKEPIAFGLQLFRLNFEGNVSFGLSEIRGAGLDEAAPEFPTGAINDEFVEDLQTGPLLTDE